MKIVICGSMAFAREMVKTADKLEKNGHQVVLPRNTKKYASQALAGEISSESAQNKIDYDLIREYYNEIKNADAILVLNITKNGTENYIGGNSFLEMGFAHVLDKLIYLLNDIPDLPYTDEIKAARPIVLNGDLAMITYR